jgi:mannose/fructose/N-acetylgalactosamine-specific phosphotransferase system component IIC
MTITMILAFALLGAILGLDVVSFPQVMISRPIVASTLAGTLGGSASDGLLAGVFLEMMALETLPVGASRYPEWGTASVVGGALYVSRQGDATSALLFAMLGAMITAWVGGYSMYALRRLNGRWTKRALPALEAGDASVVTWLQMRGLGADLLRGFVLTALALVLLVPLTAIAVANGHGDSATIRAVLVAVAASIAGSAAWKLSHGSKHGPWFFVGGLAIGCAMLLRA